MKYITLACCMVALAGCSSSDDDGSLTDLDSSDSDVVDVTEVDVMAVAANPDAVFVTPEGVNFQETPFQGVELANAFSNDDTGSHETFVRVAAGGEIPPHMHTQGTYSVVVSGPMEIPVPLDEMNTSTMVTASGSFVPPATEHLMGCLTSATDGEDCVFLIHQDGAFDVFPTGSIRPEMGTAPRDPAAREVPFDDSTRFVDVGVPGVDFRAVVGDFSVQDGTQHGTLVRVQPGMGIPPHFHTLEARGFVLLGDVEVPVPFNQTNPIAIQPGGYFSVPALAEHEMNCASDTVCIFYLRQDGDFDFTPVVQ